MEGKVEIFSNSENRTDLRFRFISHTEKEACHNQCSITILGKEEINKGLWEKR